MRGCSRSKANTKVLCQVSIEAAALSNGLRLLPVDEHLPVDERLPAKKLPMGMMRFLGDVMRLCYDLTGIKTGLPDIVRLGDLIAKQCCFSSVHRVRSTMNQVLSFCSIVIILMASTVQAEVTRVEVLERKSFADGFQFGQAGAYESVSGR